jgi:hypothetical protein
MLFDPPLAVLFAELNNWLGVGFLVTRSSNFYVRSDRRLFGFCYILPIILGLWLGGLPLLFM